MASITWSEKLKIAERHLRKHDKKMAKIIIKYGHCTIKPHTDYYAQLVGSIIGQQLSEKAGDTIYKRFLELFDGKLPKPEDLVNRDSEELRQTGISYAKASYIKDLAGHIIDGRLDIEHIATLPDKEVINQLIEVKGIGEWTAHMFMIFSLGRLDVLPVGDLGVRKAISNIYGLDNLPTPDEMRKIAKKNSWYPYCSVASWYMWRSLENQPTD